ncbi:hypothetical protein Pint_10799 [Pistacia integerrima]|uniref:Uncharacterized protein n=1 Tax=Pistacia integerrima TaxID=434235 RepID=A0ACC0XGH4_9ROSI|nr:hypothetical protein Pint_10799 [Pistacia integerrima]
MDYVYLDGFNEVVDHQEGTAYLAFTYANDTMSYFILNSEGKLLETDYVYGNEVWEIGFSFPENECDVYGSCGDFGTCNSKEKPICRCTNGFQPRIQRNGIEETGLVVLSEGGHCNVPDYANWSSGECRDQCLNNCSSVAYAYDTGIGCITWSGNLIDIQKFPSGRVDLYIRLAHSELAWRWMAKRKAMKDRSKFVDCYQDEAIQNFLLKA